MDRRDRDNRRPPQGPQDQGSRGYQQPAQNRRGPAAPPAPKMASYEDPNAYRSPGFQDYDRNPYAIDYAGLPKDDEADEGAPQPGNAAPRGNGNGNNGHGNAPRGNGGGRFHAHPRGMNGRRPDRSGTDPNAYRSPAFREEQSKMRRPGDGGGPARRAGGGDGAPRAQGGESRSPSRRERRAERPRFETTCQACGAAAVVPFEPGPDRPAFCKPCYEIKKVELGLGPGRRPPAVSAPSAEGAEGASVESAPVESTPAVVESGEN